MSTYACLDMARPREFDLEEALDKAQAVFWERGYASTTTAELALVMGIQKGSLFHAFGDKRSLFIQTLTRYLEKSRAELRNAIENANDPMKALKGWVQTKAERCATVEGRLGCFGVNSSVGLAAHDPELALVMSEYWGHVMGLCAQAFRRAQTTLRANMDPDTMAYLVMVHLAGMNVIARQGLASDRLVTSVSALFESFCPE